jgi:hypothetical protein
LVHGKIGHCLVFKAGLDGDEYVNHSLIALDTQGVVKWGLHGKCLMKWVTEIGVVEFDDFRVF